MVDNPVITESVTPPVWKVLVVDPEEEVHSLTRRALRDMQFGDRGVEVLNAYSAKEALDLIAGHKDIAVAIIDMLLKQERTGIDLVHTIRRELKEKLLRIILHAEEDNGTPEEGLIVDYDINDYKGAREFSAGKLRSALISAFRSYQDLRTISHLNKSLERKVRDRTHALSEANLKLRAYITRLENDQAAGSRMQQKLLPDTQKTFGDCTFSSLIYSSMYLSGDFLDYFEIDEEHIGFYMADVSGHGISSAFITVLLKNYIDVHLENYLNEGEELIFHPHMLMKRLNNELLRESFGKYLTIFYGIIDLQRDTLRYTNCGQFPYPLLRDRGRVEPLSRTGTPVGLFSEPEFIEEEISISRHAALLLVSDGILEVMSNGTIRERLDTLNAIFTRTGLSLQEISEQLGVQKKYSIPDDVTFLMMKRSGLNGSR